MDGMVRMCVCMLAFIVGATASSREGDKMGECTSVKVYLHDTTRYKNASFNTAAQVLPGSSAVLLQASASTQFGEMYVFDDVLTSGPSMRSRQVGRAQGTYVYSGRFNLSALWTATAFLGERGSISFMGSEFITNPSLRSLPVVGGTGSFARCRGIVTLSTLAFKVPHYFVLSLDFHLST